MEKTLKENELAELAQKLAKELKESKPAKGARVLALVGDLGAGKTTFTKYFLAALGVKEDIISPTFLIIKSYPLTGLAYSRAVHIDTYRLEDPKELLKLGFGEQLADPKNIILVEWAERIRELLPQDTLWLEFSHQGPDTRNLKVEGRE